jgi:hypothetical protein
MEIGNERIRSAGGRTSSRKGGGSGRGEAAEDASSAGRRASAERRRDKQNEGEIECGASAAQAEKTVRALSSTSLGAAKR